MKWLSSCRVLIGGAALLAAVSLPLYAGQASSGPGGTMLAQMGGGMGGGMMGGGMMGGGRYGPNGNGYGPQPPDGNARGAQVEQRYCTQCHGLPDPRQHAARDWPQVVSRMENYMAARGVPMPSPDDSKALVSYLQKYSVNASR